MAKELKSLHETPPEGIIVGVNDDNFSVIFADIEGPGIFLNLYPFLSTTCPCDWSFLTLQLGRRMKMVFSAWSWYCPMISRILLQKVRYPTHNFSSKCIKPISIQCFYFILFWDVFECMQEESCIICVSFSFFLVSLSY